MSHKKAYTLKDSEVENLFKKFSYPILKPCTSSSQKKKATDISKTLWLALITGTDSQDNIYNLLRRMVQKHDDAIGLGSLYFFKMKMALTKEEHLKLKKHYSDKDKFNSLEDWVK